MVRLVRDVAKSCKKDVALVMSGEDTEIDRNVVEALYEPMVHMIRNSIDHGMETSEERKLSGKPEKGTVSLKAYHKGGHIVIEITDDGKGLNTIQILEKAMSLGLVDSNADLSDAEIFQLIMKPGFSTAKTITGISGRGVGMDVVKKAIDNLNGRLAIHSEQGKGSTFVITLPLTLAIIEGMLVRVGHERFIVPTMAILESFRPRKEDYYTVEGRGEMLMFRKCLVPVIRLSRICNVNMDHKEVWNNIAIVVENNKEQRCILIDELLGKEEFVIKSLGESLEGIKGLAGGAIMGDGKVGLILDIAGLFEVAMSM
jgi:two-component system chemotaxis sensor kinase CheA